MLKYYRVMFGLLVILCTSASLAEESAKVKSEVLLKTETSWDGVKYESYPGSSPELTLVKITIPPNTALPWHTHDVPNAAYVLSGELTVEKKETGESKVIKAGDTLAETVHTVHRGVTHNSEVVLLVFYANTKGQPLSKLVP